MEISLMISKLDDQTIRAFTVLVIKHMTILEEPPGQKRTHIRKVGFLLLF